MRLIRRTGSKNERRNKEETMLHGCMKKEQRETVMHEAKLMREAAENYLLAPMAVRKYYLSLYCGLLKNTVNSSGKKGCRICWITTWDRSVCIRMREAFFLV